MDNHHIQGGDDWEKEIESNLRACKVFIVTITEDSVKSKWVQRECILAENLTKTRIPLLRNGDGLPFRLIDLQYIDFRESDEQSYKTGAQQLLNVLAKCLPRNTTAIIQKKVDDYISNDKNESPAGQAESVVSTIGDFIGKLWQSKNQNSKAYKVCMHCEKNSYRAFRGSKKETLKTTLNRYHRVASPSSQTDCRDITRQAIKELLFCIPQGWVDGDIPSEEDADDAKDFLCRARVQARASLKQKGGEAQGVTDFLQTVLNYLRSERKHSFEIKHVPEKIVLKLWVNDKQIGPLDFTPDGHTLKLLLEGINSLLQSLMGGEYSPENILVGGPWAGSVYISFSAPETVMQTFIEFWNDSNQTIDLGNGIVLTAIYSLFSASETDKQMTKTHTRIRVSDKENHEIFRFCKSLVSVLEGIQVDTSQFLFEDAADGCVSDFSAYKLNAGDEFTFLIPSTTACLEAFVLNDANYWWPLAKTLPTTAAEELASIAHESMTTKQGGAFTAREGTENALIQKRHPKSSKPERQKGNKSSHNIEARWPSATAADSKGASGFSARTYGTREKPTPQGDRSHDVPQQMNVGIIGNTLAYNEMTISDNGSVLNREEKRDLRVRHGYCTTCEGNPTLLYVIKRNRLNPLRVTKEPRAVPGECAGGICFVCHPEQDPERSTRQRSQRTLPSFDRGHSQPALKAQSDDLSSLGSEAGSKSSYSTYPFIAQPRNNRSSRRIVSRTPNQAFRHRARDLLQRVTSMHRQLSGSLSEQGLDCISDI